MWFYFCFCGWLEIYPGDKYAVILSMQLKFYAGFLRGGG